MSYNIYCLPVLIITLVRRKFLISYDSKFNIICNYVLVVLIFPNLCQLRIWTWYNVIEGKKYKVRFYVRKFAGYSSSIKRAFYSVGILLLGQTFIILTNIADIYQTLQKKKPLIFYSHILTLPSSKNYNLQLFISGLLANESCPYQYYYKQLLFLSLVGRNFRNYLSDFDEFWYKKLEPWRRIR